MQNELPPQKREFVFQEILNQFRILNFEFWITKNIAIFAIGYRIGSLVLVAFRLLFCEVKRPKFNEQINNRHIKCSRHLAWVCLDLYGYLVVPSSQKAVPTFPFFWVKRLPSAGRNLLFNLNIYNYEQELWNTSNWGLGDCCRARVCTVRRRYRRYALRW